jgi:hypothetical protein
MSRLFWPDLQFGPCNLWTMPPAWKVQATHQELEALARQAQALRLSVLSARPTLAVIPRSH